MKSLSIFVGTGACNANCESCAGQPLRQYAPTCDDVSEAYQERILKTLRYCHDKGATSLSITSSGEPTLSPRSVNRVLYLVWDNRLAYNPINLYTNGYRIGTDGKFGQYLRGWASLGLTTVYVTVHSVNSLINAHEFGMLEYPSLQLVFDRIHEAGLKVRANLVLTNKLYPNAATFMETVWKLRTLGADMMAAWPIRDVESDTIDLVRSPHPIHLAQMKKMVQDLNDPTVRLVTGTEHDRSYENEKVTLFPDGTLSNKWCNH